MTDEVDKLWSGSDQKLRMYGIRLPDGSLARLHGESNGKDRYACGESRYHLTDDEYYPVFLTSKPEVIQKLLFEDCPWYNTDLECPGWGNFEREDLTPVEVEISVAVKAADIKPIENVPDAVETRDIGWVQVKRYLPDAPKDQHFIWVLVSGKVSDWQPKIGNKLAFGSIYNVRQLLAVGEPEDEWADLCENKQGVVLICQGTHL